MATTYNEDGSKTYSIGQRQVAKLKTKSLNLDKGNKNGKSKGKRRKV